uniref:Methyltransferase type 11 domain-containing protein n=1 Tax=Chromera velia CCMP2878 TaxID=1169474 RepID=A0A0G4I6V4_9ALVE|mmetsp:Transcript_48294/g.95339  ORF Transcript_48294/g.95339 Transcript_48294/m.95339 type:complete len:308 (+) Transcript_48294:129-1052(+)|eukprot:Cvel_11521.t1-p1 / transcript=Cvel_11521.t1 / gene=Cvel_11521 / organism=Chromera_velia_CCMP2878 / gene_product=hypothetical protein / transcript_product=hypothetical protein / location=Cvel_scaffold726:61280-62592(+) / protein_length=307 / sequence_SO=supercontig / SO=protein_coding / is_pseudo=false
MPSATLPAEDRDVSAIPVSKEMQVSSCPSCHLYKNTPTDRLTRELADAGIDVAAETPIDVFQMHKVDTMHYEFDRAEELIIQRLRKEKGDTRNLKVLDVGSGFGGPARYLAAKMECSVHALELLEDLSAFAERLSKRTQVDQLVHHRTGSVETFELPQGEEGKFDAALALLSLLHVPHLDLALVQLGKSVKSGGLLFVDDYFLREGSDQSVTADLQSIVGCPKLRSQAEWTEMLGQAGFALEEFGDVTATWAGWTEERRKGFEESMERNVRVQGAETAQMMLEFYATVAKAFASGHLGGCRIVARKL